MLDNLRQDAARLREGRLRPPASVWLEGLLLDNGFQAVVFYRIARWFRARGVPLLGPLVSRIGLFVTGADISSAADIGPGLKIAHGTGLVIGGAVRVGARALLLHNVTLGGSSPHHLEQMPRIGDDVFIGAGASVIGPVRIGDGVFIGAHALVAQDVPDHSKVTTSAGLRVVS